MTPTQHHVKCAKCTDVKGVFTNSLQYKNANIANFILAVPSERNWTNDICNLEIYSYNIH